MAKQKPHLNLVFVGHVDHGKSTLMGRLFFETGVVSVQELEKYKKLAAELGKATWEYAYAIDKTKEERKRGITIDLAHKKFDTPKFEVTLIDAPGHKDFIKNMITGASQADAGILVVAAGEGIQPQTQEHIFLCKTQGVKQLAVAINKIDTINYDEAKYKAIVEDLKKLLSSVGYKANEINFIPTSAIDAEGTNVAKKGAKTPWYKGPTLLEQIDVFTPPEKPTNLPLRVPVQDVYSIKGIGTVPVGRVECGVLKVGQKVVFMPEGVEGELKTIEMHHEQVQEAEPGDNIGFNVRGLNKKDIRRGSVMGPADNPPTVAKKFTAQVMVLQHPTVITVGYTPVLHCGTAQVACKIIEIKAKLDPRTGGVKEEKPDFVKRGDAAIMVFEPTRPMVIEQKDKVPQLSTFAIRDMGMTVGAGVCTKVE
ncbi:translation elongation factor EF-1 subunit alpha [archaeon CG_4_10_14_0_2_um_filter_Archaea_38_6]|nr:MAG: translation elongation factor EF-1 subunit alpha [archaeon CG_4_10_14_0_2_um_filter_Archaea_38_6]